MNNEGPGVAAQSLWEYSRATQDLQKQQDHRRKTRPHVTPPLPHSEGFRSRSLSIMRDLSLFCSCRPLCSCSVRAGAFDSIAFNSFISSAESATSLHLHPVYPIKKAIHPSPTRSIAAPCAGSF